MELGVVGLGRMGANIARRVMRAGHTAVVYDIDPDAVSRLETEGAEGARSLPELAARLEAPRHVWVMVPAGTITDATVRDLATVLEPGDTIVDGGNTYYRDDIRRAAELSERGLHLVDVGTSGGVFGLERGFCLMVGGAEESFHQLEPVLAALAPGVDAAPRTPGREGTPADAERGYLYCGPAGAGHFVKMVHNGIEYGMMASLAEGLDILRHADVGLRPNATDAESAPLGHPEFYAYALDIPAIAELWRRGSVIGSWLLDLTAAALHASPELEGFTGRVSDSGEGRWTAIAAIEEGVPADVLSAALHARFHSRREGEFANKVLSAMRRQFGGHQERPVGEHTVEPAGAGAGPPAAPPPMAS